MTQRLDESYLNWLHNQVSFVRRTSYWHLARHLYSIEFQWLIQNDDNRAGDGIALRYEFAESHRVSNQTWLSQGCSVLELIVALSRRLSFLAGGEPHDWFWQMMENLDLQIATDHDYDAHMTEYVAETIRRVIYREYSSKGHGGLFPLRYDHADQRNTELWYQLGSYLEEWEQRGG